MSILYFMVGYICARGFYEFVKYLIHALYVRYLWAKLNRDLDKLTISISKTFDDDQGPRVKH